MSEIVLNRVSKVYPGGVKAGDRIDLTIKSGEFMVLVGPPGWGKTTLGAASRSGAALSWILFVIMLAVTASLFATGRFWVF